MTSCRQRLLLEKGFEWFSILIYGRYKPLCKGDEGHHQRMNPIFVQVRSRGRAPTFELRHRHLRKTCTRGQHGHRKLFWLGQHRSRKSWNLSPHRESVTELRDEKTQGKLSTSSHKIFATGLFRSDTQQYCIISTQCFINFHLKVCWIRER